MMEGYALSQETSLSLFLFYDAHLIEYDKLFTSHKKKGS